ncbi:isocitrate lyase/phosphoenolpyruvate mutase family protein [Streptomyces griseoruber]|uniref:isocitrate lyase/phosphoenolpyruvate mutase family protein n=1 Tax=Streptomyces griseoruber TaxID=1943 RepID=UPI003B8A8100
MPPSASTEWRNGCGPRTRARRRVSSGRGPLDGGDLRGVPVDGPEPVLRTLFVNARTDTHGSGRQKDEGEQGRDTPSRLDTYQQAGADGVFVPGLTRSGTDRRSRRPPGQLFATSPSHPPARPSRTPPDSGCAGSAWARRCCTPDPPA